MANRLFVILSMMIGTTILFYFSGLLIECDGNGLCDAITPSSTLLDLTLHPEKLQTSTWFSIVLAALTAAGAAAVAVGLVINNLKNVATAGIVILLISISWDFVAIYNIMAAYNRIIAILIFSPLLFIYILSIHQYWGETS